MLRGVANERLRQVTTVRQPMEAMGGLAVNIVMEGINAALERLDWNIVSHKMNPELVIRESTRAVVVRDAG